jgi:hypothetical protein
MAAQYAYTLWLFLMALKAFVGFRANIKVKAKGRVLVDLLVG